MESLLPRGSGLFETTVEDALDPRWSAIAGGVAALRTAKMIAPPPSWLPFLVWEYGLGELTPFVPNLYTLVAGREGVRWQRLRGTPAAVAKGLGWLGYTATIEEAWSGRAFWNSSQLRLNELPANDDPDLERIEGIVSLSLPRRSKLRRGVCQYDATAIEADGGRLDDAMLERESGVAVTEAGMLWSFGRTTEIEHLLTEAEGTAIGNWLAIPEEDGLKWVDLTFPWMTASFPWAATAAMQRRVLMAAWFEGRAIYATLRDAGGDVIGHRLCRSHRPVVQQFGGRYGFAGTAYQPIVGGTRVYVEAMTDFGDAADAEVASVELTVGAELVEGVPAGRLWLRPGDLSGGHAIAVTPVDIPLRTTVREQIKFLLRF